jgi:hypothetical protein
MKTILTIWRAIKAARFFQTFKEEMITIPLALGFFFVLNYELSRAFPDSAFFDFASQVETLAFRLVSFTTTLVIAWIGLRVAFPPVFKYLTEEFYQHFDQIPESQKRRYAAAFFLVFILSVALVSRAGATEPGTEKRTKLIQTITSQLNVRETGPNTGPEVSAYLRAVGVYTPAPWCAAFVSYSLTKCGIPNPRSAWSPDYAKQKDVIWTNKNKRKKPLPGDVLTYYYQRLGRVGHVGFLTASDPDGFFITIEGNTNGAGSREGDGVYKKKRDPAQVHAIARYILD